MTTWKTIAIISATILTGAFLGCSAEVIDLTGKGEESPLPDDAKDDSFQKPTEHGNLTFGLAAGAQFTDTERFHVWTFSLSAGAKIQLRTSIETPNLDTVMYVYRREAGTTGWGSYKFRNDDHADNIWSQIELEGDQAEYRVLVKAFKTKFKGDFRLQAECFGDGCPALGSNDVHALPNTADALTQACFGQLNTALHSPVMGGDGFEIRYELERSKLTGSAQMAADYYAQYWNDIGVWEDLLFDEEQHIMNIETVELEDGSLVRIDLGGDEDSLTFLFDGADALLALYHSEQSPTWMTFCEAAPDDLGVESATIDEPGEFCFGAWLSYAPHDQDSAMDLNGVTTPAKAAESETLSPMVAAAVAHYAKALGAEADTTLTFDGQTWESEGGFATGAFFTVRAEGAPRLAYEAGDSEFDSTWLFHVSDETGKTAFLCTEN